ncbi:MAG: tetratricopeptide repeat protein [Candidatus Sulfotelmatobacter sp.]
MNQPFNLDVSSFQKLLEAAWVLQCEHDRELNESHMIHSHLIESHLIESPAGVSVLEVPSDAVPSDKDERNTALALPSPTNLFEPARTVAEARTPKIYEILNPGALPGRSTIAPISQQAEVAGALALATDRHGSPLADPVPFGAADVLDKVARGKMAIAQINRRVTFRLVRSQDKYRVALRLVPVRETYEHEEHALARRTASVLKRASRVSTAYAGPVAVLAIMLAFVFSLLGIRGPSVTAVKAADSPAPDYVAQTRSAVTPKSADPALLPLFKPPALEPPASAVLEPSHMRVTDAASSSLVAGLSRYEIQTVSRQARYGDDVAALTLAMAYEIGRNVPQSCTQAAHWVAVAAEEGNSAAQYNLALRYVSGDGTPTNLDEARKWLKEAAGQGYQKAQLTLQASGL